MQTYANPLGLQDIGRLDTSERLFCAIKDHRPLALQRPLKAATDVTWEIGYQQDTMKNSSAVFEACMTCRPSVALEVMPHLPGPDRNFIRLDGMGHHQLPSLESEVTQGSGTAKVT